MKSGQMIDHLLEDFAELEPWGLHALLLLCRRDQVDFDLEQSVRIDRSGVFPKRLLISLDSIDYHRALADDPFLPYARMKIPYGKLVQLQRFLPKAWRIHFGWELGPRGWIGKSYLEMRPRVSDKQYRYPSLDPDQLLFLGYKWPLEGDGQSVVTKYNILAHSPAKEAIRRWESCLAKLSDQYKSMEFKNLTNLIINCDTTSEPLLLLDVCDEGSTRISYDINLYDLEQTVDTIREPFGGVIFRAFGEHVFQDSKLHLSSIATKRLGHLASGIDRNGFVFWTLYYGAIRVITQRQQITT
jgi:hypothetical protein